MLQQADDERPASSCGSCALSQVRLQNLKDCESAVVRVLLGRQQGVGTQEPVSFAFTLKPSLSGWESKCSPARWGLGGPRRLAFSSLLQMITLSFYLFSTERSGKVTHLAKVRRSQGSRTNNCNTSRFNLDGSGHQTRSPVPRQAEPVPLLRQVWDP